MTNRSSNPPFEFFKSKDPDFYKKLAFHKKLPTVFGPSVKRHIGSILDVPAGLRQDDPDIDNLADDTFERCRKKLDAKRIAEGKTRELRCFTCWAFLLRVATNLSIDFIRKNGKPWNHKRFIEDLLTVTPEEYDFDETLIKPGLNKDVLRNFLSRHIPPDDLEMLYLRYDQGCPPREINERFKRCSPNLICVRINRALAVARRVLTPEVIEQLKRGENGQQD